MKGKGIKAIFFINFIKVAGEEARTKRESGESIFSRLLFFMNRNMQTIFPPIINPFNFLVPTESPQ